MKPPLNISNFDHYFETKAFGNTVPSHMLIMDGLYLNSGLENLGFKIQLNDLYFWDSRLNHGLIFGLSYWVEYFLELRSTRFGKEVVPSQRYFIYSIYTLDSYSSVNSLGSKFLVLVARSWSFFDLGPSYCNPPSRGVHSSMEFCVK